MENSTILLVEDNVDFAAMVKEFLESNGYRVEIEKRGDRAAARILRESPSLVLLDVMLPGQDGLSVCRSVREKYHGPILMLTALDEEVDEVTGLQSGADDYVVKPVRPQALLARIQNLLGRSSRAPTGRVELGRLAIDSTNRNASMDGHIVDLSSAEFDLLWLLAQHAGHIVTRDEIYRSLRGIEYDGMDRSMDVRIARLRRKLGDDARNPTMIKHVRSEGYLLVGHGWPERSCA
ncbi:MAG: response regulator [Myxococcota bacterium]|jgi:two-component system response regulator RstA|nr:response regulator [Myxococcota bacterium]